MDVRVCMCVNCNNSKVFLEYEATIFFKQGVQIQICVRYRRKLLRGVESVDLITFGFDGKSGCDKK